MKDFLSFRGIIYTIGVIFILYIFQTNKYITNLSIGRFIIALTLSAIAWMFLFVLFQKIVDKIKNKFK